MNRAAGSLTAPDGTRLHRRSWEPDRATRGAIIVHGLFEHSGRYDHVAERLAGRRCAVHALDNRGHGLSAGARGDVRRFEDLVDDVELLAALPGIRDVRPRFLIGHSLGGLIALAVALRGETALDGLVLSAPAACVPPRLSPLRLAAGRLLARALPRAGALSLPLDRISRDPAVVDAYNRDPLVHPSRLRARMGSEMLREIEWADHHLPRLGVPLLVLQGTADAIVDPACARRVWERAGSADRTLRMYEGLWHEVVNEPERDQVLDDVVAWMDLRSPPGRGAGRREAGAAPPASEGAPHRVT